MLNETQKQIIRLLIEVNPKAEYMAQLASDDVFALAEIESKTAELIRFREEVAANFEAQKSAIELQLTKIYNELELLKG
jgi:hypothetical protein